MHTRLISSSRTVVIGLAAVIGITSAALAGPIEDRQAAMKNVGKAMGALAAIAKKEAPFDAAVVKDNATALAENVKIAKQHFPEGSETGDKETWAKPEIWQNKADFDGKAMSLAAEADKLVIALRANDKAGVAAAFKDTAPEALQEIFEGARSALENVNAIDAVFNEKIPGEGPDLSPLLKVLQRAVRRLAEETGSDAEPEAEGAEPGEAGAAPAAAAAPPGAITSPQDVQNTLDRIIAYYAANEPSSPVPTILRRAKRLVGADFMTIMKDIAPGGIDNVRLVGGFTDEEGQ